MGRSSSLKSNEAATVPKDGPIYCFVQQKHDEIDIDDDDSPIGMKASVELLSNATRKGSGSSPSTALWSILANSDQLRPQLQALQAYRSKLLQAKETTENLFAKHELIGTYRLLLEWSLSNDIPTPLRRAILSNLETLNSVIGQEAFSIRKQLVDSSLGDASNKERYWSNPLQTLFEMLNYEPTRLVIVEDGNLSFKTLEMLVREASVLEPVLVEASFFNKADNEQPQSVSSRSALAAMESCVLIASTLKLFLAPVLSFTKEYTLDLSPLVSVLNDFSWKALTCRGMPADELNVIGVVYGQTLFFDWKYTTRERGSSSSSLIAEKAASKVKRITAEELLPHQNKLAAVQGITATLSNEAMISGSPPLFSHPIASYLLEQCQRAPGSTVRLAALRALNTLINRCLAFISADLLVETHLIYINELASGTLDVVLQAWENPPGRQVATAVPGLFRSLVKLLRNCDTKSGVSNETLKTLVKRILDLPPSQKGKYIALESLVPEVGAKYMIDIARQDFIATLITEIGKRGPNAVAITDLLGRILSRLRMEMDDEAGLSYKTEKQRSTKTKTKSIHNENEELPFLPGWTALWAPPLANALISGTVSERKHISSRLIPLLVTIVGGQTRRQAASHAFCNLLDEVEARRGERKFDAREQVESYATESETQSDRILWAKLEIARQATLQKLMKTSNTPNQLVSAISKSITNEILESSLTHSSPSIRLAAFGAIETVVPTYFPSDEPSLRILEKEISYWRLALPYVTKCGNKEFNKELLLVLKSLIDRLSGVESSGYNARPDQSTVPDETLPILTSFVCDFLVTEVIVQQGAYPGTVADKEEFVLSLFQCILSFVTQDGNRTQAAGTKMKAGKSRCKQGIEMTTMRHILAELLSDNAMSALFSLLNSMWDSTRDKAFATLCQLVEEGHAHKLSFPARFLSPKSVKHIHARSIYLASSPRQREADTGSRMLAFLCALLRTEEERCLYTEFILALLTERLDLMATITGTKSSEDSSDAKRDTLFGDGTKMPMAHGLMMAIRLTIENDSIHLGKNDEFYQRFVLVCCMALQQSLSIVADLKEGTTSPDEDLSSADTHMRSTSTPLNVNTGAIGANAGYSSIEGVGEDETIRRFAFQRIVMASWLMTKEACASLCSSITCKEFDPSVTLIKSVGSLLIRTLTSLKHQGAAFAAHRALQVIAEFCYSSSADEECVDLPLLWVKRLVSDISGTDNVRDSTLRRSTGYALGFLSIMRSEPPSSVTPRTLCPEILGTLVQLSLPSAGLEKYMDEIGLNSYTENSFYSTSITSSSRFLHLEDKSRDQWRTRVHALNILRLAILDAPLASDTSLFISDAIVSSLIGYEDSRWTVRNSATMVFAAAMLRVVDADKNASSSSGDAITAKELFRRYPMLQKFLLRVLEKGVEDMQLENNCLKVTYPSLYPILLLLSRLQPVAISGEASIDLTEPFIPSVSKCLMHRQHKIRLVAALALQNLASNDCGRLSFADELLINCEDMLIVPEQQEPEWNTVHGALLGIQQLLSNMANPDTLLSRTHGLQTRLYRLCESDFEGFRCPPPCASIALEILTNSATIKGECALNLERDVGRTCINVITELQASNCNVIGVARLGAIASRGCCGCCVEEIWDPMTDSSRRQPLLESLSFLLENDIIDVRLEAAKAFKKGICFNIDRLLSQSDISLDYQRDVMCDIACTLHKALMMEIERNDLLSPDETYNLGVHPPTVRRLSRCLIECFHALWALDFLFENDGILSAIHIWEMCLKMLHLDGDEESSEIVTDNLLNGNAIELMAFAIQAWVSTNTLTNMSLRIFVDIVFLMSDEQASWRLRHSVAVATETSQVLLLSSTANDFLLVSQDKLIGRLLIFLQDSDPDVRFVAGRAIMQAGALKRFTFKPSTSQLVTEESYEVVSNHFSTSGMSSMLLRSILESCREVMGILELLEHEIAQSTSLDKEDPMNLGTERKIFEDEVSNSFEEVLLANQLRAVAIVKSKSSAPIHPEDGSPKELLAICANVVKWIGSDRAIDIAHDVTWSNTTFPLIHSLIVGSTAAIYVGAEDFLDLRGEARRFLALLVQKHQSTFHVSLLRALEVLASARPGDEETKQSLVECCFLVPSHSVL